jgi:acyl carrier protein
MAMSRDEIYEKVQAVLVDALGVDEEEVTPNAVIRDDLGAESIDFLDIMFRLEKAFNIKIPKGELMPENVAQDPNLVKDGVVTPQGIAMLKEKMPHSDFNSFEADPKLDNMSKLFTVNAIVNYVQQKLAQPQTA